MVCVTLAAQRAFVASRPAARRVVVCSAQQKAPLALPK